MDALIRTLYPSPVFKPADPSLNDTRPLPPKPEDAHASLRDEDAHASLRDEDVIVPPRHADAHASPRRADAHAPPSYDARAPPSYDASAPPSYDASAPPSYDDPRASQHYSKNSSHGDLFRSISDESDPIDIDVINVLYMTFFKFRNDEKRRRLPDLPLSDYIHYLFSDCDDSSSKDEDDSFSFVAAGSSGCVFREKAIHGVREITTDDKPLLKILALDNGEDEIIRHEMYIKGDVHNMITVPLPTNPSISDATIEIIRKKCAHDGKGRVRGMAQQSNRFKIIIMPDAGHDIWDALKCVIKKCPVTINVKDVITSTWPIHMCRLLYGIENLLVPTGVVHLDIKSNNMVINKIDGTIKLIDYGMSLKMVDSTSTALINHTIHYRNIDSISMFFRNFSHSSFTKYTSHLPPEFTFLSVCSRSHLFFKKFSEWSERDIDDVSATIKVYVSLQYARHWRGFESDIFMPELARLMTDGYKKSPFRDVLFNMVENAPKYYESPLAMFVESIKTWDSFGVGLVFAELLLSTPHFSPLANEHAFERNKPGLAQVIHPELWNRTYTTTNIINTLRICYSKHVKPESRYIMESDEVNILLNTATKQWLSDASDGLGKSDTLMSKNPRFIKGHLITGQAMLDEDESKDVTMEKAKDEDPPPRPLKRSRADAYPSMSASIYPDNTYAQKGDTLWVIRDGEWVSANS